MLKRLAAVIVLVALCVMHAEAYPMLGPRTLLLITSINDPAQNLGTHDQHLETVRWVRELYRNMSAGLVDLQVDAAGPYLLSWSSAFCDYSTVASQSRTAAAAEGYTTAVSYIFFAFYRPGCTISGSWLSNGPNGWHLMHELGHFVGLSHANRIACPTSELGAACVSIEYGNPYSPMSSDGGLSRGFYTAHEQWSLGWIGPPYATDLQPLTEVSTSGSYAVENLDDTGPSLAPKAIRIVRGTIANEWLWVESRNGRALVYWQTARYIGGPGKAYLVPAGPEYALPLETAWTDVTTGIAITAHPGATPNGLLVDVHVPGGLRAPAAPAIAPIVR